jgi:hypothetical protein
MASVSCFPGPASPAFFQRDQRKTRKRGKLSVLSASAVNNSNQAKTLLGSQIKPPFLGMIVDFLNRHRNEIFSRLYLTESRDGIKNGEQSNPNVWEKKRNGACYR